MDVALSLCWLFLAFPHMAETHIVDNFNECNNFFYKNKPPVGFQDTAKNKAYICQMYKDTTYFATLYDRDRRIPLFSAYKMDKKSLLNQKKLKTNQSPEFNVEPQLVYRDLPKKSMLSETETVDSITEYNMKKSKRKNASNLLEMSQAVNADYRESNYTRGHLNPKGHHGKGDGQEATCTLTNVVPQTKKLNGEIWKKYETEMTDIAKTCTEMFVVTGIVPGNNRLNARVNIPSHVWSAYCCIGKKGKPTSGAALASVDETIPLEHKPVMELEKHLKVLLKDFNKSNLNVFKDNCRK
uniref:Endonuclease domain-containing 1 protein n=1 Tax=Xenopus tropicalis TaxID=8364 RepID=A0A803J6V9_XENTR|eukprot:XP_017948166.1 PREDICTED: endonuclease domain-containing 1 protein-like [Xenopus tropicalis]